MAPIEWVNVFSCHTLLEVDPRKLMRVLEANVWKPERLPPLLEKLQQGGEMDAPIVERLSYAGFGFMNGIHRTAAAVQLGLSAIKIAVLPEEKDAIERLLKEECPKSEGES